MCSSDLADGGRDTTAVADGWRKGYDCCRRRIERGIQLLSQTGGERDTTAVADGWREIRLVSQTDGEGYDCCRRRKCEAIKEALNAESFSQ